VSGVVTGGRGFIGRRLLACLARRGETVLSLVRPGAVLGPGEEAVELADSEALTALLGRRRCACVYHLAGVTGRGTADAEAVYRRGNVEVTRAVLQAAAAAGVGRVVLLGSAEEYGYQPGPLREDGPARPLTAYGRSKLEATRAALDLHRTDGLPVVVLRPFTVYGPGQPAGRFLADLLAAARAGEDFAMTEGRQRRDFVHVDDVVAAILRAGVAPSAVGRVVNVGSGVATPLREVAALAWSLAGARGHLRVGARPAPREELADTWADITRARTLLGWEPAIALEAGLRALTAESPAEPEAVGP
jgi:nucleoside-diphosphate-sugar epimerase